MPPNPWRTPKSPRTVSDAPAEGPGVTEPAELVATADDAGTRVDQAVQRLFPDRSRSALQRAVKDGAVTLNGAPTKSGHRLKAGDVLRATAPAPQAPTVRAEDLPLTVLHEDERFVLIDKAAGMIVHPGRGNPTGTLAAALQHRFDALSGMAGAHRPGIVHRLDRDTSGVLIVAKDDATHAALSAQFAARTVKKEYAAIVRGLPGFDSDWIEAHVRTDPKVRERMRVCEPTSDSREARTFYEVAARFPAKAGHGTGFSHMRMFPHTGRTHQLRVHLQHLGHPIVADAVYGREKALTVGDVRDGEAGGRTLIRRQALHARRLSFDHPATGGRMTVEAPLPPDMAGVLEALNAPA